MFRWESEGGPVPADSRSKADVLRGVVTDRLSSAVRDILAAVERTVAEYEEEASGLRSEIDRQRLALEALLQVKTEPAEVCPPDVQLIPVSLAVKEEEGVEGGGGGGHPKLAGHVWSEQLINQVQPESLDVPVMMTPGETGGGGGKGKGPEEVEHVSEDEFENLGLIAYIEDDFEDDGGEELPPLRETPKQKKQKPRPLPRSGTRTSLRLRMNDPKQLIQLKLCIVPDPYVTEVSHATVRAYPVQKVSCPVGLQQEDFLDLLRVTFPQINNKPFDLFWADSTRTLQPLHVDKLTAEEIRKKLKNTKQCGYIRLRADVESNTTHPTKLRFVPRNQAKTGTDNGHSFIDLEFLILDESNISRPPVESTKQVRMVRCPLGLQEEDFLSQLRSLFPQLEGDTSIELFRTNLGKDPVPVNVTTVTPEEIWKSISADGPESTLWVQKKITRDLQEDEDDCIRLNTFLILDPDITSIRNYELDRYQSQVVQCPLDLQEDHFLSQLRSTFPELDGDVPFELLSRYNNDKLMPLDVTTRTPAMIRGFIVSLRNRDNNLYVQLKGTKIKRLLFKIRVLEQSNITRLQDIQPHTVSPLSTFTISENLDALGFEKLLSKRIHRIRGRPYDLLKCNQRSELVPLGVDEETAENIYRSLRSTTLYIRMKEPRAFKRAKKKATAVVARFLRLSATASLGQQEDKLSDDDEDVSVELMVSSDDGEDGGDHDTNEEDADEQTVQMTVDHVTCDIIDTVTDDGVTCDAMDAEKDGPVTHDIIVTVKDEQVTHDTMDTAPQMDHTSDMEAQSLGGMSCKVCGSLHKRKNLLTKHATIHVDDPRSMCGVCGMVLPSAQALRTHLLGHQTIHTCNTCGKSFLTRNGLHKHGLLHTAQRPHACHICHKTFAIKSVMKAHMRFHDHHKAFRCTTCRKVFTTKAQLTSHSAVHSSQRLYVCVVCGKALKSLHSLKAHIGKHSCNKMINMTCKICRMRFYSMAHFSTHMEIHKR